MPTLPKYERKEIPGVVPGVRADPGAMTQDLGARARMGSALADTGFAITDVGIKFQQKLQEAEILTQYTSAYTGFEKDFDTRILEYQTKNPTNVAQGEEDYAKIESDLTKKYGDVITQPGASGKFNKYIAESGKVRRASFFSKIDQNRITKSQNEMKDALSIIEEGIIAGSVSIDLYKFKVAEAVSKNVYGEFEGKNLIHAAEARIKVGIKQKEEAEWKTYKDAVYNGAVESPSYEIAEDYVKNAGLGDETGKMLRDIKTHYETQEANKIKEDKEAGYKWENDALVKLQKGTLDVNFINTAPREVDRLKWQSKLDSYNASVKANTKNPLETTDPSVDYRTMQEIYSSDPPSETEIMSRVGKGLSVDRGKMWIEKSKKPLDSGYERALDYLKSQIMPRKSLIEGESSEESNAYFRSVLALDEIIKKAEESKRPLTATEIVKEAMRLAPSYQMSIEDQLESLKKKLGTPEPKKGMFDFLKPKTKNDPLGIR